LINKFIHDKVDQATLLYDLLLNIKDYIKNKEFHKKFEIEKNGIPKIGLSRFFALVDDALQFFLTPVMLGK
jgi:hypothetical protein